ncbi:MULTISPECIES: RHS repeat-associated core domain-containing protein [unclassified Streptomyces]|uniref:RHS repeat-associated core domain-containing protein n=1 Tax=unclassified Streptomyces TaxID=2593676 RepID=UPI003322D661
MSPDRAADPFDPYGNPRGTASTWADNRTFLNKITDATTGLIDIGAREHDPVLGRFVSLDPVFEATSSQELNGYTYTADNPVSQSDPTGLCADRDCPTRPAPGYENTTPGHTPGKPKKSANTLYEESKESYNGTAHTGSGDGAATHGTTTRSKGLGEEIAFGKLAGISDALDFASDVGNPVCWFDSASCSYDPSTTRKSIEGLGVNTDSPICKAACENGSEAIDWAVGGEFTAEDRALLEACGYSFAPTTPVLMAHGKSKPNQQDQGRRQSPGCKSKNWKASRHSCCAARVD